MNFWWWNNYDKDSEFFRPSKTKTGNSYFISACKCTLFDAAVSSDLYPDIVQIVEGVCTNFVCTHFSNRRELKFTLDNWLLFLKVTSRKIRISNL